jgi:hypothetical protein
VQQRQFSYKHFQSLIRHDGRPPATVSDATPTRLQLLPEQQHKSSYKHGSGRNQPGLIRKLSDISVP